MFTIAKRSSADVRVTIAEADGENPAAVVVLCQIEPKMRRRALHAAQRLCAVLGVNPADGIEGDVLMDVSEEVSRELLRLGILGVEGIVDEATGKPFELTPDQATRLRTAGDKDRPTGTIDDLLADERVFAKLDAEYVIPDANRRAEKNALSGSPNGTSKGATPGKDIVTSHAKRKRARAAKNAPTRNTRSAPTKRKTSGRS